MEQSESKTADRMRRAVSAAVSGKGAAGELQDAARALVKELSARNEPPEQVLLAIKAYLTEAGLRPSYASSSDGNSIGVQNTIYRDVIAWAIKAYYETR